MDVGGCFEANACISHIHAEPKTLSRSIALPFHFIGDTTSAGPSPSSGGGGAVPPPRSVPSASRSEITSPSVWPWPGHAKLMGAPLSKAPPQLFTLINLMWRSVEGIVWKSSQCRDPVPCRWTEGELGKGGWGWWMWTGAEEKKKGWYKKKTNPHTHT